MTFVQNEVGVGDMLDGDGMRSSPVEGEVVRGERGVPSIVRQVSKGGMSEDGELKGSVEDDVLVVRLELERLQLGKESYRNREAAEDLIESDEELWRVHLKVEKDGQGPES